jgi:hypothetical protein
LIGGARRNRTADLFNAIEALSQLSYDPAGSSNRIREHYRFRAIILLLALYMAQVLPRQYFCRPFSH